jgi:hypothetical protein
LLLTLFSNLMTLNLFYAFNFIVAELSPPPEPFEPTAEPEAKKEDEITKVAEAIMDEVVTRLLNEAAKTVLKEE